MKTKILLLLCFSFCALGAAFAQHHWKTMEDVRFNHVTSEDGYRIEVPVFGSRVKELQGSTIRLKGYIIPLQELRGQNYFVFSRYPFNLCYFCGAAGPETIIEVNSQREISFTEDLIELEGRFELNASDPDHLMYRLREAKQIKD